MPRIFVNPSGLSGQRFSVEGDQAHHVLRVLRKKAGDLLSFTDGQGHEYSGRIEIISRGRLEGKILGKSLSPGRTLTVRLFAAIPKAHRMDWLIEKAVELGAADIYPIWTRRSVVKSASGAGKLGRWRRIAGEALAQSGGSQLCEVHAPSPLEEASAQITPHDLTLVAWEKERSITLKEVIRKLDPHLRGDDPTKEHWWGDGLAVNIVTGPEGGFNPEEIRQLKTRGARTVSLGQKTLRSETAPLMILSAILYEQGLALRENQ